MSVKRPPRRRKRPTSTRAKQPMSTRAKQPRACTPAVETRIAETPRLEDLTASRTSDEASLVRWLPRPGPRLLAIVGYLVVSLLLTMRVWRHPTTEYIGFFSDPMMFMEFLGWFPFAISHGLNPLHNTYVNLPGGSNMMWATTVPLLSILLWPVTVAFNVMTSWNVAVLCLIAADGYCTFVWVSRHVKHALAAWLGALILVLGPYTIFRAQAHLNLLAFFPIPLLFVELEKLLGKERTPKAGGARIGLLIAVELLCSEDLLSMAAIVVVVALAVTALLRRSEVTRQVRRLAGSVPWLMATLVLVAGAPLAYQFFGPERLVGLFHPPDVFVTDVVNIVVPGYFAAWTPGFAAHLASHWSAGFGESESYIGLPLLAICVFVAVRWRRELWVKVVSIGALGVLILSLGSYLHFNGAVERAVPLPGRLLAALPVFDNILPVRLDLFVDFGLAALAAVFIDRAVMDRSLGVRRRVVASGLVVLAAATLAPKAPLIVYKPKIPRYFLPGGGADALERGTVALVVPYGDGDNSEGPMLWQAMAGFRYKMVAGDMETAGRNGVPMEGRTLWGTGQPIDCVFQYLQNGEPFRSCTAHPVNAVRSALDQLGVTVIIMGPMDYGNDPALGPPVRKFLSEVAGRSPRRDQGAFVWRYHT